MKDKVIVITGASAGIGAARRGARRRARRTVGARRRGARTSSPRSRASSAIARIAVPTDVTRRADNERLRDRALARVRSDRRVDRNAGRGISRMVSELTDEDIDDMVTVNVKSVLYGIQAVLPHFKQRKRGQIIAVSSGLARFPFAPQRSAYSASKAAVNLLMASLRGRAARRSFPTSTRRR